MKTRGKVETVLIAIFLAAILSLLGYLEWRATPPPDRGGAESGYSGN
jgi:hypothetical protein